MTPKRMFLAYEEGNSNKILDLKQVHFKFLNFFPRTFDRHMEELKIEEIIKMVSMQEGTVALNLGKEEIVSLANTVEHRFPVKFFVRLLSVSSAQCIS